MTIAIASSLNPTARTSLGGLTPMKSVPVAPPVDTVFLDGGDSGPLPQACARQGSSQTMPTPTVVTPTATPAAKVAGLPESRTFEHHDSRATTSAMDPLLRRIVCESLLEVGSPTWQATPANLGFLRPCAASRDPLVRKVAVDILERWNPALPPVEAAQARWGDVEGPARMLLQAVDAVDCEDYPVPAACLQHAETAVAALQRAVGDGVPSESALRAVAWLLCSVQSRAARPHGGGTQDLGLAPEAVQSLVQRSTALLDSWGRHGQAQVRRGGLPLLDGSPATRPGQLALATRARVCGNILDFGNPLQASVSAPARQVAQDILARLAPFDVGTSTELQQLDSLDVNTASEVLAVLVESLDPSRPHPVECLYRFNRILSHVLQAPPLMDALRPLLPRLTCYAQDVQARGMLDTDSAVGRQQARMYRLLMAGYPEMVTVELLRTQLLPMLHDARHNTDEPCRLFEELWARRPDLVRPTLDGLMDAEHSLRFLDPRTGLVEQALVTMATPATRADVEWLAAQIHSPYHADEISEDGLTGYFSLADLLEQVQARQPDLVQGIRLPDASGRMAPLGRALVERVVFSPEKPVAPGDAPHETWIRSYGPISFPTMEPVYRLAFPDPILADDLLALVEAAGSSGLDDLTGPQQRAAAVLMSIDLDPARRVRLRRTLQVDTFLSQVRAPLDARSRAVLHAFGPEVAGDCCSRLERGEGTSAERDNLLSLALRVADIPTRVADGLDRDALRSRALRAYDPRLAGAARSDDTYRIFRTLLAGGGDESDVAATWSRYQDVLDRMGTGASVDEALTLFTWVESQVTRGLDRDRALTHALRCRLTGRDPDQVPLATPSDEEPHIERGSNEIDIGGVKVPVRHFTGPGGRAQAGPGAPRR